MADYSGGTGNDLVLKWANTSLFSWGSNTLGQLGNGSTANHYIPGLVEQNGVLAGKLVFAMAAGGSHCLALCSDGTLAAWGNNSNGQLGIGSTIDSPVPITVDRSGVLIGKTIIALTAATTGIR